MKSLWKIRHIETGLFYQPVRGYKKNSLSKFGKVYHQKPSLKHLEHGYHRLINGESIFFKLSEWSEASGKTIWVDKVFEIFEIKLEENLPHIKNENTNSTVDDRERRKDLSCSFCPPNKGENEKRKSKRGNKKPKYKDKR